MIKSRKERECVSTSEFGNKEIQEQVEMVDGRVHTVLHALRTRREKLALNAIRVFFHVLIAFSLT